MNGIQSTSRKAKVINQAVIGSNLPFRGANCRINQATKGYKITDITARFNGTNYNIRRNIWL